MWHHLMASLWRRRCRFLFALVSVTVLLVIAQYQSVHRNRNESHHHVHERKQQAHLEQEQDDQYNNNPPTVHVAQRTLRTLGAYEGDTTRSEAPTPTVAPETGPGPGPGPGLWQMQMVTPKREAPVARPYVPQRRLVHLDLKGAPPKLEYLRKLLPLLKSFGATGLLLEYEDTFPYTGELAELAAANHYTEDEVRSLLAAAEQLGLDVVPLVQTFGHVEYILKRPKFGELREVPNMPQSLCPSNNDSMRLVETLVDQVMALHAGKTRWLHIGCDEVFQLGACPKCAPRAIASPEGRDELFVSHVARVARYVRDRHRVSPIVWDDMLHHMTPDALKRSGLGSLVEVMAWTYVRDVYRFVSPDVWVAFGEVFPYVWGASAFKGAFGETLTVPPLKMHLENNVAWLGVMEREAPRFTEVRGMVLTGWQRYDHFATLCELLPAAVPSLFVNLLTVSRGYYNDSLMAPLYEGLQCMKAAKYTTFLDLESDPYLWDKMSWCFFPGVGFFKLTERLEGAKKAVAAYLQDATVGKAWLTEYNVRHNFTSGARVDQALANYAFHYSEVEALVRQARDTLREVYDEYTVAEWIEQNVYPMLRKLDLFRETAESLKRAYYWPVRPLPPIPELRKYGIGVSDTDAGGGNNQDGYKSGNNDA